MYTHANTSRLLITPIVAAVLGVSACGSDNEAAGGGVAGSATPTATPTVPVKWSAEATHSGKERGFKSCHGMTTRASFYPPKDHLVGSTDIWSHCAEGGFTGTAWIELVDDAGVPVGVAFSPESWGVQGRTEARRLGGLFERKGESWDATVQWRTNADVSMVDHIEVRNHHAPRNRVLDIVKDGMAAGEQAAAIYQQLTTRFPSN